MVSENFMKKLKYIVGVLFGLIMITSAVFFFIKIDFSSSSDKEIIYVVFLFLLSIYILSSFTFLILYNKSHKNKYLSIYFILGLLYLIFLTWLIFQLLQD